MTRPVRCLPLLLASLAAAACTACAQRDSRPQASREVSPEAPRPAAPQAAREPKPDTAPPEAALRSRTVDLGYFNEMIDQFAAAETLVLHLEAHPERFGLVRKEFQLKRPGCFRARYEFNDKEGERICDGETMWMISRTEKQYSRMPVAAGETSKLGLLPDLFRDARQIAAGEDEYAQILAQARRTEAAAVGEELCDVVEISLDQPSGTKALVWLTQARRLPLRVRMISATGVIDYEVRTLEIGAALDDATFTFTPGPDWSGLEQVSPRPATPQPPGAGVSESELRKRDALRAVFEKSTGAREQPATDAKEQNDEH